MRLSFEWITNRFVLRFPTFHRGVLTVEVATKFSLAKTCVEIPGRQQRDVINRDFEKRKNGQTH